MLFILTVALLLFVTPVFAADFQALNGLPALVPLTDDELAKTEGQGATVLTFDEPSHGALIITPGGFIVSAMRSPDEPSGETGPFRTTTTNTATIPFSVLGTARPGGTTTEQFFPAGTTPTLSRVHTPGGSSTQFFGTLP